MASAIRTAADLRQHLGLPPATNAAAERDFPTFVPIEFAARIRRGDPDDPILRQVLPDTEEDRLVPGFSGDPVGDLPAAAGGGLIHKYDGRALLITTAACGVHCRYCFRREFPYIDQSTRSQNYAPALAAIGRDPTITEIILSGGDPLTLDDPAIDRLLSDLESIPHLTRIRMHSRMPIVIPSRITDTLIRRLRQSRLVPWMVVHTNHANEIDAAVTTALSKLIDHGIPTLNQSVLLAGVNDNLEALKQLSETLIDHRVIPYYLHQIDRAAGTHHFEVPHQRGLHLITQLKNRLPGYAVPQYVQDLPGQGSKLPVVVKD